MRIELNAERVSTGELAGAWRVAAWCGSEYLGDAVYIFYSKRDALKRARESVKERGGLGIWAS
jgi:hypothetical protein